MILDTESVPDSAFILAGGFGTRLRGVIDGLPKPMAPINGKPFLEYLIHFFKRSGIKKIVLLTGYLHESIESYFRNGSHLGIQIEYSIEPSALGTAGALRNALSFAENAPLFFVNGDTFFPVNLADLYKVHRKTNAMITMALKQMDDCRRYGMVDVDCQGKVVSFKEKQSDSICSGLINGGIYLVNPSVIQKIPQGVSCSFEKEILPYEKQLYGVPSTADFIDIGIPEDYQKACDLIPQLMNSLH
jgi:D-glycero-alpha-D-manno-heptose 1-phosphate guanylyltransferase